MAEIKLFNDLNIFKWEKIETFFIRSQYNEMLNFVLEEYDRQYKPPATNKPARPNFLNKNHCLTIAHCDYKAPTNKQAAEKTGGRPAEKVETNQTDEASDLATSRCIYDDPCWDYMPIFIYERECTLAADKKVTLPPATPGTPSNVLDFTFNTNSLSVGAVIWLYFYERMGIFKILGALLDDYNYRGKYTISGNRANLYSRLMDKISTLHRIGISSNLRDRVCLYQRVLGVSIENKLGIESERNSGFMDTFNLLIDYMLEYYKAKQLAQAIQAQSTGNPQPRSSVATQTSIRDTINVLQQHFEPLQYGRNLTNTMIGIATVHATLCLVNMLKTEIGIPAQYEKPEEFIPAAYDILVTKRTHTLNQANRFIIYDNCASYGYCLLTDIEAIIFDNLKAIATGSSLDTWLNDIEGLVEGYRNAYRAVPEKVEAIV
ncbi:MAG TPA: hypothetical protein VNB22_20235 [Pyrinomonadaceae bacterium]|jgi:hypothetical protein|nr:hypothetical protein [Pyrinomonadaceae bacterium]